MSETRKTINVNVQRGRDGHHIVVPEAFIAISKPMPNSKTAERDDANYRKDAQKIRRALVASLPIGTVNELRKLLDGEFNE